MEMPKDAEVTEMASQWDTGHRSPGVSTTYLYILQNEQKSFYFARTTLH